MKSLTEFYSCLPAARVLLQDGAVIGSCRLADVGAWNQNSDEDDLAVKSVFAPSKVNCCTVLWLCKRCSLFSFCLWFALTLPYSFLYFCFVFHLFLFPSSSFIPYVSLISLRINSISASNLQLVDASWARGRRFGGPVRALIQHLNSPIPCRPSQGFLASRPVPPSSRIILTHRREEKTRKESNHHSGPFSTWTNS